MDAFWLARTLATRGKLPRSVDRYHNLGTTMTVETKSLVTQINNDHLVSRDEEENDEDEEVVLTPSSGMLWARHCYSCGH
jgi:hypothetical protein